MKCPYCSHQHSKVVDSRDVNEGVRRRRECLGCGLRFTTYERVQTTSLLIIKKDGRREEFNREKLTVGIRKACAKRPVANETIERLVEEIEAELGRMGKAELPSSAVGELVMERLRRLDHIAFIRFASVYRAFADIGSLKHEVDTLVEGREPTPAGQLPLIPMSIQEFRPAGRYRKK